MTSLRKQEIEQITSELAHPWGCVRLDCDGYAVSIVVVRTGALKYGLTVYINGWQKGEFVINDCEERRRFLRPSEQYLYSSVKRQKLIKDCGKRLAQKIGVDKRFTLYSHNWLSVNTMLRHFMANNTKVDLVELGRSSISADMVRVEEATDA